MKNNPDKVNPIEVESYLKGISFPADKEDIINQAKQNHAPEKVIKTINHLRDDEYNSPAEIAKAVNKD